MININIVHLCLQAPYNDYWGYQDNLLPKYHRKLGHNVTVITTNTKHENNKIVTIDEDDYTLSDGQRIIRLDHKKYKPQYLCNAYRYFDIFNLLCEIKPDFIMIHGLGSISALQVIKYIKKVNKDCIVIADNHLDYNIGKIKNTFKNKVYRLSHKLINAYTQKYYKKVYGVTPWRVEYCQDVFGIDSKKTDLLVMGADDENIDFENKEKIKQKIRNKHNVNIDDFLIVTGGKIDKSKNIHLLMQAVSQIEYKNIKLIVFGNPSSEIEKQIFELGKNKNIELAGWISAEDTYNYFLASDLAVFPGQHSVLWEQACACGIPCVFKYWKGMNHVDVGGNCKFLYNDSTEEIKQVLIDILENKHEYKNMKKVAVENGIDEFSYSKIAIKCLTNI